MGGRTDIQTAYLLLLLSSCEIVYYRRDIRGDEMVRITLCIGTAIHASTYGRIHIMFVDQVIP